VLIPLLDILQSVPILGYLSFTVVFFISLFPGNTLGPELAAVFAIFTSQAWNMAFSFYQASAADRGKAVSGRAAFDLIAHSRSAETSSRDRAKLSPAMTMALMCIDATFLEG